MNNYKTLSNHDDLQRDRLEVLETAIAKINKQVGEVIKKSARAGTITGGNGAGGGVDGAIISELEDDIAKLRSELEGLKNETGKHFNELNQAMNEKTNRSELDQLEQRLMDKLQELLNNMSNVFVEKEPVRKKFLSIEKNVRFFILFCPLIL